MQNRLEQAIESHSEFERIFRLHAFLLMDSFPSLIFIIGKLSANLTISFQNFKNCVKRKKMQKFFRVVKKSFELIFQILLSGK